MKIQVTKKSQYGRERIFPVDDNAKTFAKFIERETFDSKHLEGIKALGFEIEYVSADKLSEEKSK